MVIFIPSLKYNNYLTNATWLRYYCSVMKNTNLLRHTLNILENVTKPITAQEIITKLQPLGIHPHKTTIYRLLERLQKEQKVQPVQFEEKSIRYEKKSSHHHHIICEKCDGVEDLIIEDEKQMIKELLKKTKSFIPLHHQLEIFGICASCTK